MREIFSNFERGSQMPTSLMQTIELKRQELITLGTSIGLTAEKTVQCSQELDNLLNVLHKQKDTK